MSTDLEYSDIISSIFPRFFFAIINRVRGIDLVHTDNGFLIFVIILLNDEEIMILFFVLLISVIVFDIKRRSWSEVHL